MAKGTVNKVILLGRLGADPEMRYMPSGTPVCTLRVATNDGYKDKQTGQFVENTEWHRITLFSRLAEIAGQYLKKGGLAYIEGRLRTNKWQDQSGQDRYTTEIVGDSLQLIGAMGGGRSDGDYAPRQNAENSAPRKASAPAETAGQKQTESEPFHQNFDDDEIPF